MAIILTIDTDTVNLAHIKTTYPKPKEGEYIPITFINLDKVYAGWSPVYKRTIYKIKFEQTTDLKRVREIYLLEIYNWLYGNISLIELSLLEKDQFKSVLDQFSTNGGQIYYTRKMKNNWLINYFYLKTKQYLSHVKITSMEKLLE